MQLDELEANMEARNLPMPPLTILQRWGLLCLVCVMIWLPVAGIWKTAELILSTLP